MGLVLRAAFLQLVPDARLDRLRDRQFQTVISLQARRGSVLDRKGRELAMSMTSYSLYADPKLIKSYRKVARKLSPMIGMSIRAIEDKLKDPDRRFVWLSRQLSEATADRVRTLGERGLSFVEEYSRFYPHDNLLAPVLGMVGSEGQGLEGLELQMNTTLQGNKMKVSVRRDARGRPLLADGKVFAETPAGGDVHLTIDSAIQHLVEQQLSRTAEEFEADQVFGVVMDANTSGILALGMTPGYDANAASKVGQQIRRARVITDTFEPGSVMKTFTIAAALREKLLAPNTRYNTEGGRFKVGAHFIKEAEASHNWKSLTVSEILAFSSNVGTAKIAFQLGDERLRKAFEDFGFGQKTGLDFPGDARGILQALPWKQHLTANVAFGQGVAASAIQVANAYAAIANGGVLRAPYIVSAERSLETGELIRRSPVDIRRVMSPEDAAAMRMILAGVTAPGGSGVSARIEGFTVGGKTGTGQKVNPNTKGYAPGVYVSSFAGFFPVHEPKYVIYVVVDNPKKNAYYGSQVAAPLFARIAGSIVRTEGLAPVTLKSQIIGSADKGNKKPQAARKLAGKAEEPSAKPSESEENQTILRAALEQGIIPPLEGLTVRELLRVVNGYNFDLKIKGAGRVSRTYPSAGEKVFKNRQITVFMD